MNYAYSIFPWYATDVGGGDNDYGGDNNDYGDSGGDFGGKNKLYFLMINIILSFRRWFRQWWLVKYEYKINKKFY
jgi:hypothetical protein